MTGRRLSTAGRSAAVLALPTGTAAVGPATSMSADGHAAVRTPGGPAGGWW